jgi:hypothetical protein
MGNKTISRFGGFANGDLPEIVAGFFIQKSKIVKAICVELARFMASF